MASVACTSTGGTMLGKTCRSATRQGGLPVARAASTYSWVAASIVAPRATRTKIGAAVMPMAIMALVRDGPRNAASAMARIRNGQASMASTSRPITPSTQPPAKPASSPTGTPTPAAISTDTTPASNDARAPNTTRDSTSRPFSSVPMRCCQDGALRMAPQLVAIGS